MNLPDLKALDKIIALCRKRGVKVIKIDNIELTLSEEAPVSAYKQTKAAKKSAYKLTKETDPMAGFESDSLTEDQLLFFSVAPGGIPTDGSQEPTS
jgi:hypothetical protein